MGDFLQNVQIEANNTIVLLVRKYDMENGQSLLDVIDDTSDLFGNNDASEFNWADDILGENEAGVSSAVATEHGNLATTIIPSNIMTSQNYITSSNPSQTIKIATSQHPYLPSASVNSASTLQQQQHGAALVGQTIVNSVQNVGQSVATQLFQQGNQQYIIKTAGGQLHLTTQPQVQFQQSVIQSGIHAASNQYQQAMAQNHGNRQSPALSASPLQNRSLTPGSSVALPASFVTAAANQNIGHLKCASPAPNVNILHLPQVQQAQPQIQLAPTVLQLPGAGGQQIVNANLLQGLSNQQQVVNTQNTVIQNPNVVNLNVAHQLPLGVQSVQTAAPQAPFNIQGTLIQTPEGKSILIPTQNMAHAVNIQTLGQLQLPSQVAQTVQAAPIQPQTQTSNTVANVLKLQGQSTERPNHGISQLIVNHQGQQLLIQRTPGSGAQPQNIVVRTLPQGSVVQLQQTQQKTAQTGTTLQAVSGQGQKVQFIQQGTSQPTSNVSVNIGGQNVNLNQISLQNLQLVKGTKTSTASVQQDQHHVTFQGQGHDMVSMQQRQSMTSQTNTVTSQQQFIVGGQQQILVSGTNQVQTGVSNPENIANQNYKGLSNMQQLMQKLRGSGGNKVVTLQTVADSTNVQTTVLHAQPMVTKVTTVSPNVNIVQIKREKIDTSGTNQSNISSTSQNTIKQLMLQKQAGTLGTAKIIVKQESVKTEPSSFANSCNLMSQSSINSGVNIEGLLSSSSAFTTAHVSTVTMTVSQSAMSVSSNLLSNLAQQSVSSVDIKPDIKPFISQSYCTPQSSSSISSFVNTISPKRYGASPNNSSSILSALTGSASSSVASSVTSTTNSLSGNLNSISPPETPTSKPQMNGATKPAGAMLQTIHLPPELQQHFQKIQLKIREVHSDRSITQADRQNKLQQLNMIQRKILLRGKVLATTRAEPHHIQQGLQALASPPHNQSSQTTQVSQSVEQISSVSQQKSSLGQQLQSQQSSAQQLSQHIMDSNAQSMQTMESGRQSVPNAQESAQTGRLSVTSAQQMFTSDYHQSSPAQHGILSGLNVPMSQHSPGLPVLSAHITSSGHPPSSSHQMSSGQKVSSGHSFLSAVEESLSPTGHPAYMKPLSSVSVAQHLSHDQVPRLQSPEISSNMVKEEVQPSNVNFINSSTPRDHAHLLESSTLNTHLMSTSTLTSAIMTSVVSNRSLPSVVANSGTMVTVTSSNTMPISSTSEEVHCQSQIGPQDDPNKAAPTQIKIGNKILTLNLTKQQKDKVQGYLDRMTPEQQQQYLQTQQGILNRIQRQQELNAQIQAQVDAQKQKQQLQGQNQLQGPSQPGQASPLQKVVIVPQKNIVQGQPLDAVTGSANSPSPLPEVKVIPVPKIGVSQLPGTTTEFRGQKRSLMDIPKGTLINQQLRQDQNLAVNPDTKRQFRSTSDACRRLLRYHVFQSYGSSGQEFERFDNYMEDIASDLLCKKNKMMDKFRILMLKESMRQDPSAEIVMLQRIQNQELKKLIEEERKTAKNDPDSFIPLPMKYLMSDSDGETADETIKQEPSDSDSSPQKTEISRDKMKSESVSDSETSNSNEPEHKKMKTLVIRLDSRLNFQSSFKRNSLESRSSLEGSETEKESVRDNMDTSTQESDDEASNDSVKTEIVDTDYMQETVKEEVVEEEIVTDFNADNGATETLQELPNYAMPLKIRTKAAYKHFDSKSLRRSIEDESSKTVTSISSAEESQADDVDDESNENSQNVSPPRFSQYSDDFEHHGNTELASESIYFSQTHSHLDSLNSDDHYSNITPVEQTRKYLPEHSPVSNDSFDNEAVTSGTDFNNSDFFKYQPITESLTDSEENSYYSADNTIEPNSLTVDDTENDNVPWSQPSGSSQARPYSESEHSGESDPEVKAQMESAINSILSLNQGAPNESQSADYGFSQSNPLFATVPAYQSEASDGDSQSGMRIDEMTPQTSFADNVISIDDDDDNDDNDVVIVGDDIDAAVQSILM